LFTEKETAKAVGASQPLQLAVPILRFHVTANAKVDKVIGAHGAAIKIKLRAPAVEGKANVALHHFLADRLQTPTAISCSSAVKNCARN